MPIKNLSESRRLPRLGKIHTGIKKKNNKGIEYPMAVDYFVFPSEVLGTLETTYGTRQPKQLPILIPLEDEERWCNQYYRAYSKTRGLLCKGDGETCHRLVDTDKGAMATHESKSIEMVELACDGRGCPEYQANRCREMMMLQFLLPDLPGLGVWQLDTGSINAMLNINSAAALIRRIHGHVAMIPLLLTLEPQAVRTPDDKQRTMPIINLRIPGTLKEFMGEQSALPPGEPELPDESYPELTAPDAQAPEGEEPEPEIDTPTVHQGKPEVTMPRPVEQGEMTWP